MPADNIRNRMGLGLLGAAFAFVVVTVGVSMWPGQKPLADPDDGRQVARGKVVYVQRCMACHGESLEGQPNWRERLPSGRMPAPPHDASGHTWHHPDGVLFGITKHGLVPGKYAPPRYQSDMPAFGSALTDEDIWAVLAYIKSSWPQDIRKAQREITLKSDRR
jgi:S-disulfanyl-L-cysteine oxidoreductase SoxD